ncbi:MAG: ornithine carbamoyltransferase [Rhodococcus sp. (in: high G+C Gram-positive bacteria)]
MPCSRGSLLKEIDLTKAQFLSLVEDARLLAHADDGEDSRQRLAGKNIALVFEKSSTRTRCAFEVAAHREGAHVTYLGPSGSHLGKEESIRDTARVLGRMFDGIEFRGFSQSSVEELAEYAGVPVWNGLTDQWHPTQMLADIMTMIDNHDGPVEEIVYSFVGDGRNNVARSLLVTGALLGMNVRIVAPRELWPPADVVDIAETLAVDSRARILITDNISDGVDDADFVYTDMWVSMGESDEQWSSRVELLSPYRVTEQTMKLTGKSESRFMHCLPSVHDRSTALGQRVFDRFGLDGAEVTDDVFESPQSLVFEQAENRLHTIRAVLVAALAN